MDVVTARLWSQQQQIILPFKLRSLPHGNVSPRLLQPWVGLSKSLVDSPVIAAVMDDERIRHIRYATDTIRYQYSREEKTNKPKQ